MTACPVSLIQTRAYLRARHPIPGSLRKRIGRVMLAAALAFAAAVGIGGGAHAAEPVNGEVKVSNEGSYTRLIFRLDEAVDARVRVAGEIIVIEFKRPVAVSVDRLNAGAPEYISAARRDPDGMAIRIALARKLKVNTIPAAERLYIDLLPDNWTGTMPGLPQDVVDELATRAREAERLLRKQNATVKAKTAPTVRVKVAKLPTFMRYVFDMPRTVNVAPERADGKLLLHFDQQVKWDLADAKATLPSTLESIDAETNFDSVTVVFQLNDAPEVRSFHEDRSFVVDIGTRLGAEAPSAEQGADRKMAEALKVPAIAAPETVPAKDPTASKNAVVPKGPPIKPAMATQPQAKMAAPAPMTEAAAAPAKAEAKQESKHEPVAAPKVAAAAPPATKPQTPPAPPPAAKPEMARAEMAKPEMAKPEMAKPETAQPDAAPKAAAAPPAPAMEKPAAVPEPKTAAKPAIEKPAAEPAAPKPVRANPVMANPAAAGAPPPPNAQATVVAIPNQAGDNLRVQFPFAVPTPAAVFRRADMLWLVFDSAAKIDLSALTRSSSQVVRDARFERSADGSAVVRLKLTRPMLASVDADGPGWVVNIGDTVTLPPLALSIVRSMVGRDRSSIVIPFADARKVHRLADPDIGDQLMVVTALAPARGFVKPQDFVELHVLPSTQGVVVQPLADDLSAKVEADKITISRPGGLSLSSIAVEGQQQAAPNFQALVFDTQVWGFDRHAPYLARQNELIRLAADAPPAKRRQARYNLARFYIARDMAEEAKGVLDVATADQLGSEDVTGSILKAIAEVMLGRSQQALKELAKPQIGNQQDAPIWRAIAYAREGKWQQAHAGFKAIADSIRALPVELQRVAMQDEMRSSIEMRDFTGATRVVNELETMGVPPELEPAINVLTGRLYQSLGRNAEALTSYRAAAAASFDRRSSAQGRLREVAMLLKSGDMPHKEVIHELETLTTVWRGDETEAEGLRILAHLYTEDNRYRDAFHVMRTALLAHPNSDLTRKIQDEAATTFDSLFLAGKGDALPPIEALGLFYDFRELTPIGRRGDEMIRRLADRLVSVDLLDQAAELLQHQVDHRLQGAARAQVATRLATIYLMARKPDRALAVLQKTRSSDLSNELRDQRLLLEARAMSDTGRHELALEVIANIKGREAIHLRADIYWAAKEWRKAAEQIELMYGNRWREFTPLNESERTGILRAAIGYALADEQIGLLRLREKYAAKMADGPDRRAFDVVSTPIGTSGREFQDVAQKIGAMNTLTAFLADLQARYPEKPAPNAAVAQESDKKDAKDGKGAPAQQAVPPAQPPGPTSKADTPEKIAKEASPLPPKVPIGVPLKPDKTPTGSIRPRPATGKTSAR
jgi:tetratricopeptide (TPR) repeat protein